MLLKQPLLAITENYSCVIDLLIEPGVRISILDFCPQESENGGDSGYPSERRSEGDPNDHVDGVKTCLLISSLEAFK